jgi:phosphopantetheine adenylyltransferase
MAGSYSLVDKIKSKLEFSNRGGKTATGEPADQIIVYNTDGVNKVVKESTEKHAVFTFGRFNPPTTGHQKLVDAVKTQAENQGAEHHIFASHSQDKQKNPLGYDEKVGFMKKMFPKTNIHSSGSVKTVLDAAKHLQARGVTHGTLVVGSDRVDEFHNLLSKYNKNPADPDYDPKKHFYIPHLNVVSAGHRDPDAEGVEGMSASKMREHAASGNFNEFSKGVSNQAHAKSMYDTLRTRMGIKEELTLEQLVRAKIHPSDSSTAKISHSQDVADARNQKILDDKRKAAIKASQREDQHGRRISKKVSYNPKPTEGLHADLTGHPYEETIPTPFQRDQMAPGEKPVDVGMDKDLEPKDSDKQLKRRKTLKLYRAYVEGIDGDLYGGADKPSANPSAQLSTPVMSTPLKAVKMPKQRIKNVGASPSDATYHEENELEEKRGLWDNIHAKRERIKHGSGEHMRKPGSKGAPTATDFKAAQEEVEHLEERGADSKGYYRSTESGAGLTRKGVAHFRAQNPGSKLSTAVTGKVKPGSKAAKRRKSFCARMSGMPGPMKDEKGRPTRKAMSLRRWRCRT